MISIKNKDYIKIKRCDITYFGGNQSWWKNENIPMKEYGCGVVSLCDLELYVSVVGKKEFTYWEYKNYVNRRYKEAYSLFESKNLRKLGLLPLIMEKGLQKFFVSQRLNPIISWAPTLRKKQIRKLIEKMLSNDMPIVASYYTFNKKRKLDLYSSDETGEKLKKTSNIRCHYFNIVGITKRDNQELLIISTWGKKYYVIFEQWVNNLSIFTNILYIG